MNISRHLDKGVWTLATRGTNALYGIFFIFIVLRLLPGEEYGKFALIRDTYLIIFTLSVTLGMAPMVKYFYDNEDRAALQSHALLLTAGFSLLVIILLGLFRHRIGELLNNPDFSTQFVFIPLLMLASFGKLYANELCRATHKIKLIFYTEALYFSSNLLLISWLIFSGTFHTAPHVLIPMVISYSLSSGLGLWMVRSDISLQLTWRKDTFSRLLEYGRFSFGHGLVGQIIERMNIYIVSSLLGLQAVATLDAVKNFLRVYELYKQSIALIGFPAFSRLHGEGRFIDLRSLYEKGVFFSYILLLPAILFYWLSADFLFDFILKGKYPEGAFLLRIFSLAGLLTLWQALGDSLIFGIGVPKFPFYVRIIAAVVSLTLHIILVNMLGLIGAVYAYLATLALSSILITAYVKRKTGFTFSGIFSRWKDLAVFVRNFIRKG